MFAHFAGTRLYGMNLTHAVILGVILIWRGHGDDKTTGVATEGVTTTAAAGKATNTTTTTTRGHRHTTPISRHTTPISRPAPRAWR